MLLLKVTFDHRGYKNWNVTYQGYCTRSHTPHQETKHKDDTRRDKDDVTEQEKNNLNYREKSFHNLTIIGLMVSIFKFFSRLPFQRFDFACFRSLEFHPCTLCPSLPTIPVDSLNHDTSSYYYSTYQHTVRILPHQDIA